jgi:glycosyltransferase involved in cell wall biosynthesis
VRILVDYRPALRERTGVGEYVHELVRAYTSMPEAADDRVALFTSSRKDRPDPHLAGELKATVVDRHIPVRVLNYAWHRLEMPAIERLVGDVDVAHSQHPLLIPAKRAAQAITIHDLFFLSEPDRTRAEIRRDYVELAPRHARRAHGVLTSSQYGAGRIQRELGVAADRIYVCPPGPPRWRTLGHTPNIPANGYVLFLGTLEPRKNVGALLDAYGTLIGRGGTLPQLVLAGRATADATEWLNRIERAPLAGHVEHRGYVPASDRESLYAGARLLVLPSLDEGFGLPVLEAMSAGVPVITSNRGSLPEVVGDAGPLVDPNDVAVLAETIRRMLDDIEYARVCAIKGLAQAQTFSWVTSARRVRQMYVDAMNRR